MSANNEARRKPSEWAAGDPEEVFLRAAAEYLRSRDWNPLVIAADRVQSVGAGSNYELVLRFTGTQKYK